MFLHHFVCSVHFPTVQKHTGFETIPHLYWKNDKGVKPANGFQPAFSGHSVHTRGLYLFVCLLVTTTISYYTTLIIGHYKVHNTEYYTTGSTYDVLYTEYYTTVRSGRPGSSEVTS